MLISSCGVMKRTTYLLADCERQIASYTIYFMCLTITRGLHSLGSEKYREIFGLFDAGVTLK